MLEHCGPSITKPRSGPHVTRFKCAHSGDRHGRPENQVRDRPPKTSRNSSERPDNDTLLKLYALFKQGSEGDVSGPKPGFFDFVGTAKYEAWAKLKGMKSDEAMQKYVDLVKKLGG